MCKAAFLRGENHPRKMIFFYLNNDEQYFDIKPLACDHISTGNSELELL